MSVVDVVLQMTLGIALTAWVVRRDERTLDAEQRERAWNDATFWVAVVVFGALCLPVHFARTRRTLAAFFVGVLWMVAVLFGISLVITLVFEGLGALGVGTQAPA